MATEKWGSIVWVSAYQTGRAYGGPEEGGWYYDFGEPIASIPVIVQVDADKEVISAIQTEGWGEVQDGYGHQLYATENIKDYLFWLATQTDEVIGVREWLEEYLEENSPEEYKVWYDEEYAKPYPDHKPHYE